MDDVYAGKERISVGHGIDIVLVKPGEPGYQDGAVMYRTEPYGVEVDKINILSAVARFE